ncbi:MAG: hypothetical protein ABIT05_05360 [Chitinophagaceae bacterium]
MKNWILISMLALLVAGYGCNWNKKPRADEKNVIAEREVPPPVRNAFATRYPGAAEIIWENATERNTPTKKVKFKKDGKYWKAEFKPDGSFVKEVEDN